jgi:hypothetical protein
VGELGPPGRVERLTRDRAKSDANDQLISCALFGVQIGEVVGMSPVWDKDAQVKYFMGHCNSGDDVANDVRPPLVRSLHGRHREQIVLLLHAGALSRHGIGKKKERTGTGYRMIGGGAYCILWVGCAVVVARAFVVPSTTTTPLGTSPSSSLARAGTLLRPPNRAQKAPPNEKPLWYQENDMPGVVENDMKKIHEQLGYVRQDVAMVLMEVKGLAKEVGIVRKKADKNKKELTKKIKKSKKELTMQAEKNKKELTMLIEKSNTALTKQIEKSNTALTALINATKTELSHEMAGIKALLNFLNVSIVTLVIVAACALVGIKVDWGKVSGFVKTCISTP